MKIGVCNGLPDPGVGNRLMICTTCNCLYYDTGLAWINLTSTVGGGLHPDLTAHDLLGLAKQSELDSHGHANDHVNTAQGHPWHGAHLALGSGADQAAAGNHTHAGGSGVQLLRTTSDQAVTTTAYADVTGMSFAVAATTSYAFDFQLVFSSAATTTGFGFSVNGPASPALLHYTVEYQTTANGTAGTDVMTVRNDTAYDAMAAVTATIAANANLACRIRGTLRTGAASGTLAVRCRSEVAGSAITIRQGSWGTWF